MTTYIYDLECYPNLFTMAVREAHTENRYFFEISPRCDDSTAMVQFLRWLAYTGHRMGGFNNEGYDYPMLHYILTSNVMPTNQQLFDFSQKIISTQHFNRFSNIIYDNKKIVPQLDLFKIHHFDNPAKATSLKIIQFNMRSESVQDLPYPPGTILTLEEIAVVCSYNVHDVDETHDFYLHTLEAINFRDELSAKYGKNFTNYNDTKIGKEYFIMELEKSIPGSCYTVDERGRKVPRQTLRDSIPLADIVFPWIKFKRPEFIAICDWFKSQTITKQQLNELEQEEKLKLKGFFTKIPESKLGPVAQYAEFQNAKKIAKSLNCIINGFKFVFGSGGIHGSIESSIVSADEEYELIDVDVASYYPNLAIVNRLFPMHLSNQFCDIYLDVYNQRKLYKKGTAENAMLKLALNGVYGDSNNPYSPFYDPAYTMSITVNGQLLLCLLADYLMDIPGLSMVQINTDGLTVRLPRSKREDFRRITEWWQAYTLLELEETFYSSMSIRDVNNYLAVTTSGKIKRKGAYEYKMGWHQDHSALVIPMAAEAALVEGIPVREFIYNHDNIFDFMLRAKVPRTSRLMIGDTQVQNICRYYVSKTGGSMVKIMPPLAKAPDKERPIGISVGWLVTEANNIKSAKGTEINMEYYVQEAEKLVLPLTSND